MIEMEIGDLVVSRITIRSSRTPVKEGSIGIIIEDREKFDRTAGVYIVQFPEGRVMMSSNEVKRA